MDLLFIAFGFITTLFMFLIGFVKWRLTYWQRKGVPTIKPHFLWGNASSVILEGEYIGHSVQKLTEHFKKKKVPFCGYYFSIQPLFLAIDYDLITKILVSDFEHFTDRPVYNHETDPLSSHLFALKGSKWKQLRAKLSPAFTISKSKMMLPTMELYVDRFLKILNKFSIQKEVIEMKDFGIRVTTDILASCIFGLETNALENEDESFKHYTSAFFDSSLKDTIVRLFMFLYPELLQKLKIPSIREDIAKFFLDIVEKTIKYREANNIIRNDFMHLLLQIKNNVKIEEEKIGDIVNVKNEKDSLTLAEIAAQCFVFFLGGYESSSSTLSFCLYELSLNQNYQDEARAEIVRAVNKNNGKIDYEVLTNLSFLSKCVKETLRKYPILSCIIRTCTKEYKIPDTNVTIETGTSCLISTLNLQYDPDVFPNPYEFDPGRFSEENVVKQHPLNWIPFGHGPRKCVAYQFGFMQVKFILASLLLNYKFFLNLKTTVPIGLDNRTFQVRCKDGIWLDVSKLNENVVAS